ncbi:MAG: hypothetical protein EHM17_08625 [Verrucomicrobiaceae bacterium]|nr:MAG: hypothetical protein EHM17_08625 [Verrucomicrobiaceae bacterium]
MIRLICSISLLAAALSVAEDALRPALEGSYNAWRDSIIRRDAATWQKTTAPHRRMEVKNRIVSEKRAFPAAVFELPAPPPSIGELKFLEAKQNGLTAKAAYFGKVDFGVGGKPGDNLLVLSFVRGGAGWLYDRADFVNLAALPEVRKELAAGKLDYLKETPEAQPSGEVPPMPIEARPAKYIAKVYVFCPGREVRVQVNKISQHRFANAKEAEVVIGGAVDGANEVQFSTRKLEGATGKEALSIRVYLMSEVAGVKPVKVFEYQVQENGEVKPFGTTNFFVDAATVAKLNGR